jgi:hypothetical protein
VLTKIAAVGAQVGKVLLGVVSTLGGAIGGGILAGFGVNELLAGTQFGQQMGARPIGQYATVAAYGAGQLVGGEDTGLQWARKVAEVFGYIEKETEGATDALEDFGNAFDLVAAEATELYSNFMEAEQAAQQKLSADIAKTESEYEQRRLDVVSDFGERRADLEEQYEQKRTDIVRDYERDRSRMIEDYNRDRAKRTADYLRKIAREQEDFERQTADDYAEFVREQRDLQQDLQRKLADLERKYHEDVEDARDDHLKRLRKLEQDHEFKVDELVAQRDALGLVQEMRRYSLEKTQLEEEYRDRLAELRDNLLRERQEIQEDYARRLQELREQFAIEQQRRREDFELKMQQMAEEQALEMARRAEDHQLELEQRQEQFKAQLEQLAEQNKQQQEELKKSYLKELQDLREAKSKQLMELRKAHEQERRERATQLEYEMKELLAIEQVGYSEMEAAARAYVDALLAEAGRLKDASGGGGLFPGFASGGYAKGLVMTGEEGREFIMTNSATRAAEKLIGGKLTQTNLLGAMMSSRKNASVSRGSSQINVYQRVDFQGYLTAQERTQLRKMMRNDARQGVLEAIGAI